MEAAKAVMNSPLSDLYRRLLHQPLTPEERQIQRRIEDAIKGINPRELETEEQKRAYYCFFGIWSSIKRDGSHSPLSPQDYQRYFAALGEYKKRRVEALREIDKAETLEQPEPA
jgi:hypothetical protein